MSLVSSHSSYFDGVVLYDGGVASTSNIVSSMCGIENMLPLLNGGSLYNQLVNSGPQLEVLHSLVDMFNGSVSGSSKNDAYEWFRTRYMSTGNVTKVNPAVHGYFYGEF